MCISPPQIEHIHWWEGAGGALVGGLVGALVGACIPLGRAWWQRRIERRGEITAMLEELRLAGDMMDALPHPKRDDEGREVLVTAPLYRLPLTFFELALPKLIGEGRLDEWEMHGLVEYVTRAEELNRGLQRAIQLYGKGTAGDEINAAKKEWARNCLKAEHIRLDRSEHRFQGKTVFDAAWGALERAR
jgi:hypothetical protein